MNIPPIQLKDDFRAAMRRLAATVSVITCSEGDTWHGMTATAVTSVCTDPATLLVCVNQSASLHNPLHAGGRFCVNLLTSEQIDVAQAFSGQLKGRARFEVGQWSCHPHGSPALRGAQANLFCTVVETLLHGSHSIFLGRVDAIAFADPVSPLIYQNGDYSMARPVASHAAVA